MAETPSPDARTHRALADDTRRRVLALLREAPDAHDAREVATAVGLHVSTAREHLERLVDAGFATAAPERRGTRGRPRRLYRSAPDAPLTSEADGYRLLAAILASRLAAGERPEAEAVAAGEAWGRALASGPPGGASPPRGPAGSPPAADAEARLVALLDGLGFSPEPDGDAVRSRHCPFLHVARTTPEVVCSVHLGLMRGALEAWEAPITTDTLQPLLEPTRCRAHLTSVGGPSAEA